MDLDENEVKLLEKYAVYYFASSFSMRIDYRKQATKSIFLGLKVMYHRKREGIPAL